MKFTILAFAALLTPALAGPWCNHGTVGDGYCENLLPDRPNSNGKQYTFCCKDRVNANVERVYRFNKIDKKPTLFTKLGSIEPQPCGVGKEAGGVKYCAN